MQQTRILLVDDHEVVRHGIKLLLRLQADIDVVGEAANAMQAIQQAQALQPDIVLLDLKMPGMSGMEAVRSIKHVAPGARVLIVSGVEDGAEILATMEHNVDGYVLKGVQAEELLHAIRVIAGGQAYIQPAVAKRLLNRMATVSKTGPNVLPPQLTQRELEVLRLMATNHANKEIAATLSISEETVRSHVKHILQKLDQPNRTQAILTAIRLGLIPLE